jgi:hypothetical protein
MSETEAAWLAGFFDGEGSLSNYRGGRDGKYRSWILSITNTNQESLDFCKSISQAGVVKLKRRNNAPTHWKISYQWQVTAQRDIVAILSQIEKYLIIKKQPVHDFIETWQDIPEKH